jgi:hypothetical protein
MLVSAAEKGLSSESPKIYDVFEEDFEHFPNGGLKFINEERMKRQRAIIWEFLQKIGKQIFTGAIFRISMPVGLCEPRSFLQRLADQWSYVPAFITPAAQSKDPVERMKLVMTFALAGRHLTVSMDKPFNPILGETFEAEFSDGTQVCVEQTSHHPPISHWGVYGLDGSFLYSGYGESVAKFRTNAMTVGLKGHHKIEFANGESIWFTMPMFNISGVVMGTRLVEYFGTMVFRDEKNDLTGCIKFVDNSANQG